MKNLHICVIVPQGHEYKLASVFTDNSIESLKRKGLDTEVIRLVDTDFANMEETIVIDSRPESEVHLHIPEYYYQYLNSKEFGTLARKLRFQMWYLDYTDRIFLNDIRSLCEYVICHCPDDRYDVVFSKYTYASVGSFQYVNERSPTYLNEIIADCKTGYKDDYIFSDILGTTYYLLARDEPDNSKKHELMMRSLAYHELCSLNNRKFPESQNAVEYSLATIEVGRMLNDGLDNCKNGYYAPYDKAIHIMKHQVVDLVCQEIKTMDPKRKQCNVDLLNHEIGIVEQRLTQIAPPLFHGQIERYLEGLE